MSGEEHVTITQDGSDFTGAGLQIPSLNAVRLPPYTNPAALRASEDKPSGNSDGVYVTFMAVKGGDAVVKERRGRSMERRERPW